MIILLIQLMLFLVSSKLNCYRMEKILNFTFNNNNNNNNIYILLLLLLLLLKIFL